MTRSAKLTQIKKLEHLRQALPADLPIFVSPQQFAKLVQMSVKTIYDYRARGFFDDVAIKQGKHIRILARPALELFYTTKAGNKP